jgi:hypothetical protein
MKNLSVAVLCLAAAGTCALAQAGQLEPAVVHVHEDAEGKLDVLGDVAVVMTGNDRFINRIMEDVLAIKLLAEGIKVAYPEEAYFGKPRDESDADPLDLALRVGANAVVTGTVVTEPPGEWQYRTVKVSIASLSLIDVPFDKSLVWALFEPDEAVTSTKVAGAFVETLLEALE